jgi:hypothetical protein
MLLLHKTVRLTTPDFRLIIGSGTALVRGGPLGLLLGYSFVGLVCYAVMVALGKCYLFRSTSSVEHILRRDGRVLTAQERFCRVLYSLC